MAENKKGFILYTDLIHTVEKMKSNKAGELFKHILRYVNDEDPITDDELIDLVFEPIKQQLKRDLMKYELRKKQYRDAGLRSAEVRKLKSKATSLNAVKQSSTKSTVNVNVNDSVNDNDIIHIEQAYDFLKNKNPIEIEAFEMQNRKSFPDWDKFITHYNYKVILDEIDWEIPKLMAKLMLVNNNWDKSPKKEKTKEYKNPMKELRKREQDA